MLVTAIMLCLFALIGLIGSLMEIEGDIGAQSRFGRQPQGGWVKFRRDTYVIRKSMLVGGALSPNPAVLGKAYLVGEYIVPNGMELQFVAYAKGRRFVSHIDLRSVVPADIPGRIRLVHQDPLGREMFSLMDEDALVYGSASLIDVDQMLAYSFGGGNYIIPEGHSLGILFTPATNTALTDADSSLTIYCNSRTSR